MDLISIDEVDLKEKRVFIRVDFNVPLTKEREFSDETRILAALPTIQHALKEKARVIIASHLGRPGGRPNLKLSLKPVGRKLSEILDREVFFPEDSVGDAVKKVAADMPPGSVMLLENLRFHKGEEENDLRFAGKLAKVADVYVNEAFSVSHRSHASVVGVLDFFQTACVGFEFKNEVENLIRLMENSSRPFVAIFGGRSTAEKIPIMESMLDKLDAILIGGAVSNTFLRVLGRKLGKSVIDQMALYSAAKLISSASARNIRLILPEDLVFIKGDLKNYSNSFIISGNLFPEDAVVVDIGPKTIEYISSRIFRAKTIFWNGPVGIYEHDEFGKGTAAIGKAIAASGAFSFAVGWDTISAIRKAGCQDRITFLSRGGKAALEFIQGKRLPALEALEKKFK